MNRYYRKISFSVILGVITLLGNELSTQAQTIASKQETITFDKIIATSETSPPQCLDNEVSQVSQRIQLFYYRQATKIAAVLKAIPSLKCLVIANYSEDSIILNGSRNLVESAYRVIASIDLPLPGIDMQMWGIQISSDNPKVLAKVMSEIREEINLTQQLLRDTFTVLKENIRKTRENNPEIFDNDFVQLIEDLGYSSSISVNRPLSLIDVVLSGEAVKGSEAIKFNQDLYSELIKFMEKDPRYKYYLASMKEKKRPLFDRFFRSRGLKPECISYEEPNNQEQCQEWKWQEISKGAAENYVKISRRVKLDFALQYGDFIANPDQFSPYKLQQTSNALNDRLQVISDALTKDIEDFFVRVTLDKIQDIVSRFRNVSYAQVGRTTIASLNGIPTEISSSSVSAFDVTPPLKLSELLTNAESLSEQISSLIPKETGNAMPMSQVVGLIAAFSEQEAKYRELNTGITLKFTPNVLRNMNSAELKIDLTIADPVATGTADEEVPPLSRIGKQTLTTSVYTQAVDFFALSTFSNQSTLDGGRTYLPIVGWIWKGVFGAIPGFGKLFSLKNAPQNVLHESLLLTNSYITPTSMGLALLYPIDNAKSLYGPDKGFCNLKSLVEDYIAKEFNTFPEMDDCNRSNQTQDDYIW